MGYQLSFTQVWHNFYRMSDGLILSLELALISIAIGILIGLALAVLYVSSGRVVRAIISAYVEFIRNVPLLLLVYLVFYGLPTVVNIAYSAVVSFVVTLSLYAGAYLVEVFRSGLDAVPKGLLDAGKAMGLTPWQRLLYVRLPTMTRITLPAL
ncbi:MAG: ABC transporter permease subunit, partial [Paracoccaceae bacterium]